MEWKLSLLGDQDQSNNLDKNSRDFLISLARKNNYQIIQYFPSKIVSSIFDSDSILAWITNQKLLTYVLKREEYIFMIGNILNDDINKLTTIKQNINCFNYISCITDDTMHLSLLPDSDELDFQKAFQLEKKFFNTNYSHVNSPVIVIDISFNIDYEWLANQIQYIFTQPRIILFSQYGYPFKSLQIFCQKLLKTKV